MTSDRSSSADVADDAGGLFGLDVAPSVEAGTTSRLVTVTNNVGQTIDVTVTLDGSTGTLSNGQGTLQPGESLEVSIDIDCDTSAGTVTFTVDGLADDRFTGSATRSTSIDTSACKKTEIPPSVITYVDSNTEEIRTIGKSGTVTSFTSDPAGIEGIGGLKADFDGDGDLDVPFLNGNDELKFVDAAGNSKTILSSEPVPLQKRLIVGDYDADGDVDVLFVNENNDVEAIDGNGNRQFVTGKNGKTLRASVLSGFVDFNGDGDKDLVYITQSNDVEYVDGGSVTKVGVKVDTVNGIGTPADVDADGQLELPFTNSNGNIGLVSANGFDGTIDLGSQIAPRGIPLATVQDWNGDGDPDIAYQNDDDNTIWVTDTGGAAGYQEAVLNSNGNTVTTLNEDGIGVA